MTCLPAELVHLIIDNHSTSTALALVNRYYNHVVTPTLYEKVVLKTTFALEAFRDTLVTGRPLLRLYPVSLHICHYPENAYNDPKYLNSTIKEILMSVPNLTDLHLTLSPPVTRYLLKDPQYPFLLRMLRMVPTKDALFVEFLRTQPKIENLALMLDSGDADLYFTPGWQSVPSPLEPQILPNLKSIESDRINVSFLVPHHPVTSVSLFHSHKDFEFHNEIAKSLTPLGRLSECIQLWEVPWETGIVSRCFPSLEFCKGSLREFSLEIVPADYRLIEHSVLRFLKNRGDSSYGLANIRNSLSVFSALKKFSLNFHTDWYNDLTAEFCTTVPELSQIDVWRNSCPELQEIILFGITLRGSS
ncbi:unnamed protein product [Rhizoctonia solani]|uniref:Uncharacterized protein n=1 Tax=Rhizoctonia solani TaxID=456999 RepID=A0A8H3CEF9_9AGAM|nr:unnamed protein product [Rhizoctonia solani]